MTTSTAFVMGGNVALERRVGSHSAQLKPARAGGDGPVNHMNLDWAAAEKLRFFGLAALTKPLLASPSRLVVK